MAALAIALMVSACASTPDTPQARAEYLSELAQAYDIEGMVSRSQTEALGEARNRIEAVRSQFAGELARATPAQRNRLEAAMDRFVSAARTPPDLNAAAAAWAQGFAQNLSNEDLRQIVAFAHTPAGQAQIAASRDGNAYLEAYLRQLRSTGVDRAVQQYMAEFRAIVTGER